MPFKDYSLMRSSSLRELMKSGRGLLATGLLAMVCGSAGATPTPMITSYAVDGTFVNDGFTIGYVIAFASNVDIMTLGYVDVDGEATPLSQSHDLSIWDLSGNPLASATVAPDDVFRAGYRYAELAAPLGLAAGQYVVGGFTGSDLEPFSVSKATTSPGVSILAADELFLPYPFVGNGLFSTVGTLAFPDNGYGAFNWVANLEYDAVAGVPEPSTLALLTLSLIVLVTRGGGSRPRHNSGSGR